MELNALYILPSLLLANTIINHVLKGKFSTQKQKGDLWPFHSTLHGCFRIIQICAVDENLLTDGRSVCACTHASCKHVWFSCRVCAWRLSGLCSMLKRWHDLSHGPFICSFQAEVIKWQSVLRNIFFFMK